MTQTRLAVPVGPGDHSSGSDDAPITLVEYGDYQCSYCGQAFVIVGRLRQLFGAQLRFVFRNLPLTQIHPHALAAAEAAEAAALQGRFWAMHDLLYENQGDLGDAALLRYAAQAGADTGVFTEALRAGTVEARIQADVDGAIRSGVNGTPTFFVNGIRHDGSWDYESLAARLRLELP